jgi:hypothetical protein
MIWVSAVQFQLTNPVYSIKREASLADTIDDLSKRHREEIVGEKNRIKSYPIGFEVAVKRNL